MAVAFRQPPRPRAAPPGFVSPLPDPAYPLPAPTPPTGVITLRPYQQDAVACIVDGFAYGLRRLLCVIPTAGGKTVVMGDVNRRIGGRILLVAPRDELQRQALKTFRKMSPDHHDIALLGRGKNPRNLQALTPNGIRITSVQRLASCPELLANVAAIGWTLVMADECHHAPARSWVHVLRAAGCFKADGPGLLGVTATPYRTDGKTLASLFQQICYQISIGDLIDLGFLSPVRALHVDVTADFSTVRTIAGDFDENQIAQTLTLLNAPDRIADAYLLHAKGRPFIGFAPNRRLAAELAAAFRSRGIAAEVIHGDSKNRKRLLEQLHDGELTGLFNASLLTEGFDEPKISCVIKANPTTSMTKLLQELGRGLRLSPDTNKRDCIFIDITDTAQNSLAVTLEDVFAANGPGALTPQHKKRKHLDAREKGHTSPSKGTLSGKVKGPPKPKPAKPPGPAAPDAPATPAVRPEAVPLLPEVLDYLAHATLFSAPIDLFRSVHRVALLEIPNSPVQLKVIAVADATRPIPQGLIKIAKQRDGWLVALDWEDGERSILHRALPTQAVALIHAAQTAYRIGPPTLVATSAEWRAKPASDAQRRYAIHLGIRVPPSTPAGAVSDAITIRRAIATIR